MSVQHGVGILFLIIWTVFLIVKNHEQTKTMFEETSTEVFSSDVVRLEPLNSSVKVEFTGDLGQGTLGTYSSKKNTIRIKCPEKQSTNELYGTIAHESTHFAMDMAEKKGIRDKETIAYVVGYTTRSIIEKIDCNLKSK
jgi:hypothetical protein